ncbi:MAG TPA: hypothetical protein VIU62_09700 [Chloroflexota bacterium]
MRPLRLAGGHRVPSGSYQEVHSGHIVYIHGQGILPGSPNSDSYVATRELPVRQTHQARSEQA